MPGDMAARRVAIIGAGASGLCALKCCLDEGLEPTCFERSKDIGGLWRFEEHPEDGRASIYRSVIINTSKEMMCYSDFPIPEDFPNYMHNSKIMEYFRMYAQHFDLLRHIRFRTSVCRVSKRPDFASSGQWEVVTESEGKQEAAVFDAVLVCSGHHTDAHLPLSSFPGLEKFEGSYLHSRDYKIPQPFWGKRVVVVGIGNSGIDIAVELSHTAKQVFLSTRRGSWVLHRVADNGYPFDISYLSRFMQLLQDVVPQSIRNFFMEWKLNSRFDHTLYGLKPKHGILDQHPTVNDDLPNRIISGRVRVKPNVREFTETSAIFEDGTREDVDAVVFATGYSFSFPFLESCVKVVENQIPLYKFMFPPELEKPTLAFIGLIQPWGAIMPISELQSRWAAYVFKGAQPASSSSLLLPRAAGPAAARRHAGRNHTDQAENGSAVREEPAAHHPGGLPPLHGRPRPPAGGQAQPAHAVPHGPQAGHGGGLRSLHAVPVPAAGPGRLGGSQGRHPQPAAARGQRPAAAGRPPRRAAPRPAPRPHPAPQHRHDCGHPALRLALSLASREGDSGSCRQHSAFPLGLCVLSLASCAGARREPFLEGAAWPLALSRCDTTKSAHGLLWEQLPKSWPGSPHELCLWVRSEVVEKVGTCPSGGPRAMAIKLVPCCGDRTAQRLAASV
ncbi:flavin-containing monooxygenase 5-like isoform X1 [Passer montanus]|uniref:flavin-containing monooxygenase 5-like isoform X1 n=1 Tax=Passer montanus TaxID=9160 RepID=UPI00195F6EA8|nr:flavin-containing monooxygenase 5-like isoform X1 [Passer montanus]XP_039555141.1 flavin-containing monooxygenase 5-like isoform X1 [Passer montanus]